MNIREFFRKSQIILLLALGVYPFVACVAAFASKTLLMYIWWIPAAYAVLGILTLLLPPKPRLAVGILGAALLVVPCVLRLQSTVQGAALIAAVIYSGLLLWGLQLPTWEADREPGAGWIGSCMAIVCVGYFLACFEDRVSPALSGIRFALFAFSFLAMLSMNRRSLNLASGDSRGFTVAMRRKNLMLTAGMFGIAMLIALIPSLFNLVKLIFDWLMWLINWLRSMLATIMPAETTVETTTEATILPTRGEDWMDVALEDKKFQSNTQATNIMMTAIVLVIIIPFGIATIYKLCKLLVKGVRRLVELIDQAANANTVDFVDEITDTRENVEKSVPEEQKKIRRIKAIMGKLTPTERIRYRYKRLQSKHPEWKEQHTARDNLPEEAAKLYERARYSDHPITDNDADQFQNETK